MFEVFRIYCLLQNDTWPKNGSISEVLFREISGKSVGYHMFSGQIDVEKGKTSLDE